MKNIYSGFNFTKEDGTDVNFSEKDVFKLINIIKIQKGRDVLEWYLEKKEADLEYYEKYMANYEESILEIKETIAIVKELYENDDDCYDVYDSWEEIIYECGDGGEAEDDAIEYKIKEKRQ